MTAAVFLVALCLRPAITAVGPLLPQISVDEHLGEAAQGLLGALPLLAFALVSPQVHRLARRLGTERAVLVALLVLAAGGVVRSYAGDGGLWVGTVVIGCAIAVGNVLVPVIVKRDYAANVSRATGYYTACITLAAATASALAVPIAGLASWRLALSVWSLLALLIAAIWLPRTRPRTAAARAAATGPAGAGAGQAGAAEAGAAGADSAAAEAGAAALAGVSVWRQPRAWLITAFMGLQSTTFYVLVTWLPTVEIDGGVSERTAGLHLFLFQGMGIIGGLTIPFLLRHPRHRSLGAVVASLPVLLAIIGLLTAPALAVLWAAIAGLGQGAALVTALTLISLGGRDHAETTRLSGMAQSLGYLLAASGPFLAGLLAEQTGNWTASLFLVAAFALLQITAGAAAAHTRVPRSPQL
ncbi:putative MFS transporter [Actinoplanes missouriensis 431]|uniref:Putative MFS transporter n=1 Tax=Actinoplanes missouriensis (strain ATCC 14538 / DSM 43046 / CBS 188.64 / JCM 3121 / NBRC 102363 / NCIMB 12654 / NRRL B-3342 / UNCC 431) TaxID=512565 RepID=I0H3F7_ACTM4|nr:MFS transporter [Actinoplanes missouriensis]BAL87544.1 putative MFS transporter [Actinoplanes missouriensis 431]